MVEQITSSTSGAVAQEHAPEEHLDLQAKREKSKRSSSSAESAQSAKSQQSYAEGGQRGGGGNKSYPRRYNNGSGSGSSNGGGYYGPRYRPDEFYHSGYSGYRQGHGERYYSSRDYYHPHHHHHQDGRQRQPQHSKPQQAAPGKKNQGPERPPEGSTSRPAAVNKDSVKSVQQVEEEEQKRQSPSEKDHQQQQGAHKVDDIREGSLIQDQEQPAEEDPLEPQGQDSAEVSDHSPQSPLLVGADLRDSLPVIANEEREPKIPQKLIFGDEDALKPFPTTQPHSIPPSETSQQDVAEREEQEEQEEQEQEEEEEIEVDLTVEAETAEDPSQTSASPQPQGGFSPAGGFVPFQYSPEFQQIRLNVGGRIFDCAVGTLQAFPGSRFTSIFRGEHPPNPLNEFFFDRDPNVFEVLINFCRTGKLYRTNYISLERIREEAEYFQLASVMFPEVTGKVMRFKKSHPTTLTAERGFQVRIFSNQTLVLQSATGKGHLKVDIADSSASDKKQGLVVHDFTLSSLRSQSVADPKGKRPSKVPVKNEFPEQTFEGDRIYYFYAGGEAGAEIEAVFDVISTFDSSDEVAD